MRARFGTASRLPGKSGMRVISSGAEAAVDVDHRRTGMHSNLTLMAIEDVARRAFDTVPSISDVPRTHRIHRPTRLEGGRDIIRCWRTRAMSRRMPRPMVATA